MPATVPRRLPGFRFEAPPPVSDPVLPRMDIAVFVGFSAAGPLHTPVRVEDEAEFYDIFGTDAPLAWDSEIGEPIYAYLAAAVRGFFRNGGQRCWVIRVAKSTEPNAFPVPGLVECCFQKNEVTGEQELMGPKPAFARARSQGRWSDGLLVSTLLESQPLQVSTIFPAQRTATVAAKPSQPIIPGDLIRLQYGQRGLFMLLAVDSVEPVLPENSDSPPASQGARGLFVQIGSDQAVFLAASGLKQPSAGLAMVRIFDSPTQSRTCTAYLPQNNDSSGSPPGTLVWPTTGADPTVTLYLDLAFEQAPPLGASVLVTIGEDMLWFTVKQSSVQEAIGSPPGQKVSVTGPAWWVSAQPFALNSPPFDLVAKTAERLSFGFRVQVANRSTLALDNLGFAPEHSQYWNGLPNDERLYPAISAQAGATPPPLWLQIARPRFPLAGANSRTSLFLPINMPFIGGEFLGAAAVSGTALARDGLDEFKLDLFLDTRLSGVEVRDLAAEAEFLRSQAPSVPLQGIHAALGIEEATMLATPDAVHRGWTFQEAEPPDLEPSSPLLRPEWWHFLPCDPPPAIPFTADPPRGHFLACGSSVPSAPFLSVQGNLHQLVSQTGTYTLSWVQTIASGRFILQEATLPDFSDAVQVSSSTETVSQMIRRPAGNYFYRVRLISEGRTSDWSNTVAVRVVAADFYAANLRRDYSPEILLGVHRTLLRACAARADALAVLALPDHYLTAEATDHVLALAPSRFTPGSLRFRSHEEQLAPRLTFGEESALSYGALYHPWGQAQMPDNQILRAPPDGMASGILARRALERGAWIAAANEPWRGIVALTPTILEADWTILQQAQVNLVRQEPRGFLTLSADTLSTDLDLRPIHVRRLLILLRRLALALGPNYVFEPNDDSFRRLVERNFEGLLEEMFRAGAFAGDTAADSFQVVTDESLNTPQSVEAGQFIVELRVAPAQALRFVTIRLLQAGNGNLSVVEG